MKTDRANQALCFQAAHVRDLFSNRAWLILVFAGIVLIAARLGRYWLDPSFFAEDGSVFFQDQMIFGWRGLFKTYAGYFHLIPRMLASAMAVLPIHWQPMAYSIAGVMVQSVAASSFFLPENRFVVRSDALRLVVCILTATAVPSEELVGDLLSVQWFLVPVALLLFAQCAYSGQSFSRARAIWYALALISIGLTAPMLVLLIPVTIWHSIRLRGLAKVPVVAFTAALMVQALTFVIVGPGGQNGAPVPAAYDHLFLRALAGTAASWIYVAVLSCTLGERGAKWLARAGGLRCALALFAFAWTFLYWFSLKLPKAPQRFLRLVCGCGLAIIATGLVVRHLLGYFPNSRQYDFFGAATRYYFAAGWSVLVAGAMFLERRALLSQGRTILLMGVMFGAGLWTNFHVHRLSDPHWPQIAARIEEWKSNYDRGLPRPPVVIPLDPSPFAIKLP
jgi:hypothetical protein